MIFLEKELYVKKEEIFKKKIRIYINMKLKIYIWNEFFIDLGR